MKNNFTAANNAPITVTHQALPIISLTYMEKYVSVHNHHQSINKAKEKDINLIFPGIIPHKFDNNFLILFNIEYYILKILVYYNRQCLKSKFSIGFY